MTTTNSNNENTKKWSDHDIQTILDLQENGFTISKKEQKQETYLPEKSLITRSKSPVTHINKKLCTYWANGCKRNNCPYDHPEGRGFYRKNCRYRVSSRRQRNQFLSKKHREEHRQNRKRRAAEKEAKRKENDKRKKIKSFIVEKEQANGKRVVIEQESDSEVSSEYYEE